MKGKIIYEKVHVITDKKGEPISIKGQFFVATNGKAIEEIADNLVKTEKIKRDQFKIGKFYLAAIKS